LEKLKTTSWKVGNQEAKVPKIGTSLERNIIKKLFKSSDKKTINDFLDPNGEKVWYYNATSNWIHAHMEENVPKVEYYKGYTKKGSKVITHGKIKEKVSSHYKYVAVEPKHQFVVNGLLNTSLFYWWFVIWSDGRDLLKQNITTFPINLAKFPVEIAHQLELMVIKLMKGYEKTAHIQPNTRKEGYSIIIREIKPKFSKSIIDEIDDIFANYFGFTKKEAEFVKTFDLKFRIEEE
jgi:hypothetical protein